MINNSRNSTGIEDSLDYIIGEDIPPEPEESIEVAEEVIEEVQETEVLEETAENIDSEIIEEEKTETEELYISSESIKKEIDREKYKKRYRKALKSTLMTLAVAAAIAVLVATIWMPVLQIYGNSMNPTLTEGDIVVSVKGNNYEAGDLVSFYLGNKLLVKRYIAGPGQWVDINQAGDVTVDGHLLDEPYVYEKSIGETDIMFPYQVPESRIFVLGDHRLTSVDSRSTSVGCVADEQVVGKIVFRVWPLNKIGRLK